MSVTMSGNFYPSIWNVDNGGLVHLDLNVTFDSTPPASFDYTIWFKDSAGNILKEWSGTKLTNGQPTTSISVNWDGKENGVKVAPYGPCRFYARITYPEGSEFRGFCNGIAVVPIFETESPSIDDIGAFTGAYKLDIVDISIPDLGIPLTVERFYSSLYSYGEETLRFGGWMFNFHEQIVFDEDDGSYIVVFPNRREIRFLKQNNLYVPATSNTYEKLEDSPDGTKILTMKNGWKHYFRKMVDFNEVEFLIRIENRMGQGIDYFWQRGDFEGFPGVYIVISKIISLTGRELKFTYNNLGEYLQISVEDWVGRKHKYLISNIGNEIVQSIDMEGNTTVYGRDDSDLGGYEFSGIRSLTRPNGKILSNTGCGISPVATRVKTQIPDIGDTFEYDYDWINYATTVTRGSRKWEYRFNREQGLLSYYKDPAGNITQYEYDQYGNKTKETDSQGGTTIYTWDDKGNMLSITDPLGNITTFEYNEYGQKTKQTGSAPYNKTTTWDYDPVTGNLLTTTDYASRETVFEYYDNGLLKKITNPDSSTVNYEYDQYSNLIKFTDQLGNETVSEFDPVGNLIKRTDSNGRSSTYEYNKNGDNIKTIYSDTGTTVSEYDGNGNCVKTVYQDGTAINSIFNTMGDVVSTVGSNGVTTEYDYDQYRQLVEITGTNGIIAKYGYDQAGRRISQIDSQGREILTAYNSPSSITTTDANGKATTKHYDEIGRIVKIEFNDGSFIQHFYENFKTVISQAGDRYGEIRFGGTGYGAQTFGGFKFGGSGTKYGFDAKDNIEYHYDQISGNLIYVKYPDERTISYGYDQYGRQNRITDIRGYSAVYEFNTSSQMIKTAYRNKEIVYNWDSSGRINTVTLPNGIIKTVEYTSDGKFKTIEYKAGEKEIFRLDYQYDSLNRLETETITKNASIEKTFRYLYGAGSRLDSIYQDGKMKTSYKYDQKGNVVEITNEDGKALRLAYDDYGALINKGGEIWQYDAERNPVRKLKADKSSPSMFVYDNQNSLCMKAAPDADPSEDEQSLVDPLGNYVWRYRYYPDAALTGNMSRRISPSGREMRFYYDGGRILNEEGFFSRIAAGSNAPVNAGEGIKLPDSSGFQKVTHLATFIYGAEPTPAGIDTTPPNSPPDEICINYYLTDKNNSIIALTDSMGNVIKEYTYNDFGERLEINTETTVNPHTGYNPIGFEGKNENLVSQSMYLSIKSEVSNIRTNFAQFAEGFVSLIEQKWIAAGNEKLICEDSAYLISVKPDYKPDNGVNWNTANQHPQFENDAAAKGYTIEKNLIVYFVKPNPDPEPYLHNIDEGEGHYGSLLLVNKDGEKFFAYVDVNRTKEMFGGERKNFVTYQYDKGKTDAQNLSLTLSEWSILKYGNINNQEEKRHYLYNYCNAKGAKQKESFVEFLRRLFASCR